MATYKISEIAKLLDTTIHTLHYYDKEGLLPFVEKDKNGNRVFLDKDLHYLHIISFLKKSDMPLKKIKEYIDLYMQGDKTLEQRREIILEHRKEVEFKLLELTDILGAIDYKTWYYDTAIAAGTATIFDNYKEQDIPKKMQEIMKNLNYITCIREFIKNK